MSLVWETKHPDFTYIWKIEHLSLCTQKNGERISSPEFFVEVLDGSKWRVEFYPKGKKDNGFFSLFLRRSCEDDGSTVVSISYRCVFVPPDLIPLESTEMEDQTDFMKGESWGSINYLEKAVLERDSWKKLYLINDTLIIRCDMWKLYPERRTAKECFGRTTIGTERISLMWTIKSFSETRLDFVDTLSILSAEKREHLFDLVMRFEAPPKPKSDAKVKGRPKGKDLIAPKDAKILIVVKRVGKSERPIFLTCKLSVVDKDGVPQNPETGTRLFETSDVTQEWNFLTWKSKGEVLEDNFLTQDILTLFCELVYSSGKEDSKIEECNYVFPPYVDTMRDTNKLATLKDDLSSLYRMEGMCDVVLRSGGESFPAHALVLSARSPVLSKMIKNARLRCSGDAMTLDESGLASRNGESNFHESKIDDKDSVNDETSKQISTGEVTETDRKPKDQDCGGKDGAFSYASDEDRIISLSKTNKVESGKDGSKIQDESCKEVNEMSDVQDIESHRSKNGADTEESLDSKIILDIDNLDAKTLKGVLYYLYTDSVEQMDFQIALDFYSAATKYKISSMKLGALNYLKSNLSVGNVCDVLDLSGNLEDDLLKKAAFEYIGSHVVDVLISKEWVKLTKSKQDLVEETCVHLRNMRLKLEI